MNEIIELLEQGRVVVAKAGEKADPEDLGIAVLEYCEGAGFTIDEVRRVEMVIYSAIREIMDRYGKKGRSNEKGGCYRDAPHKGQAGRRNQRNHC